MLPVTTLFFWKFCSSLRTYHETIIRIIIIYCKARIIISCSYKGLIWCTNYTNVYIHSIRKRWSFIFGCFLFVSILNKNHLNKNHPNFVNILKRMRKWIHNSKLTKLLKMITSGKIFKNPASEKSMSSGHFQQLRETDWK